MNFLETSGPGEEAVIEYGDGEFHILKPGAFVTCAVTGTRIPLKALRYWNVDKQEAYASAEAAHQGFGLKSKVEQGFVMKFFLIAGAGLLTTTSLSLAQEPDAPAPDVDHATGVEAPDPESLARRADFAEAMRDVSERQKVFDDAPQRYSLSGSFAQGGLVFGETEPGSTVRLDGNDVMVGEDGRFVIGFGRDSAPTSLLVVTLPDGAVERTSIDITDREFPVQRIDGLDQSKVSGFTEEQLEKIAEDSAKKKAARQTTQSAADWAGGFDWPVVGPISGVFGSQRILNGEPKRPHSGVDVAAPTGTPIRAPSAGIVTLAETGMYFEGGLVLIDHGHWLESAFLHMSRIDVEPGQRVKKGDIIGAVGATGRVTGPHLHWSMKWVGRLLDPQLTAGEMPEPAENEGD